MGQRWLDKWTQLFLLFLLCSTSAGELDQESQLTNLDFPEAGPYYSNDLDKRLHSFVRIGRGLSSFIRIGKSNEDPDIYQGVDENPDVGEIDGYDADGDRALYSWGTNDFGNNQKRKSSFVRIGRNPDDYGSEYENVNKRAGAFIRMGKFPSSAFLRSRGRMHKLSPQPYYRRTGRIGHSFIRIGKRDTTDALRRNIGDSETDNPDLRRYLRLGKQLHGEDGSENDIQNDKRKSSFVRIGREPEEQELGRYILSDGNDNNNEMKRLSSFVRIGKALDAFPEKRKSSFVRIGRNSPFSSSSGLGNEYKRKSSFVRIGKNLPQYPNDFGKRMSSFVRIGKSPENFEKRKSSFVRIGKNVADSDGLGDDLNKRANAFVRIGKDGEFPGSDLNKRMSSFVRIGKDGDDQTYPDSGYDKRKSSFVRIGKSDSDYYNGGVDDAEKRISSFVRIGKGTEGALSDGINKRKSSFVRIGKRTDNLLHDMENDLRQNRLDEIYTGNDLKASLSPFSILEKSETFEHNPNGEETDSKTILHRVDEPNENNYSFESDDQQLPFQET